MLASAVALVPARRIGAAPRERRCGRAGRPRNSTPCVRRPSRARARRSSRARRARRARRRARRCRSPNGSRSASARSLTELARIRTVEGARPPVLRRTPRRERCDDLPASDFRARTAAVVGAGTMGSGIAMTLAGCRDRGDADRRRSRRLLERARGVDRRQLRGERCAAGGLTVKPTWTAASRASATRPSSKRRPMRISSSRPSSKNST